MDRRHRAEYDPPGAKGPLIWYLVGNEPMEIRMNENVMDDCFAAAKTLDARFFIMRWKHHLGVEDCWAVFDTQNVCPDNDFRPMALQGGKKARPVRIFDTETLDAPVMWAITLGGRT